MYVAQEELDPGAAVAMGVPLSGAAAWWFLLAVVQLVHRVYCEALFSTCERDQLTWHPPISPAPNPCSGPAVAAVGGQRHQPGGGCPGGAHRGAAAQGLGPCQAPAAQGARGVQVGRCRSMGRAVQAAAAAACGNGVCMLLAAGGLPDKGGVSMPWCRADTSLKVINTDDGDQAQVRVSPASCLL